MHMTLVSWLILLAVPVGALILGIGRRTEYTDYVDYFLARRKLSSLRFLAAFLGANVVFTAIFLVLSLEAARRGLWALSVPIAFLLGTVLLVALYPKLRPFFERGQTLHQALGSAFDQGRTGWKSLQRWAAIWTIVAFIGMVAIEFYGGILLLKWTGVPLLANLSIAVLIASVCALFTIRGGLRGLARVDVWLDALTLIGVLVFLISLLSAGASIKPAGPSVGSSHAPSITENLLFAFGAAVLFVPMPICALDTWQRGVGWHLRKGVSPWVLTGGVLVVLIAAVAILAGLYAAGHGWSPAAMANPLQFTLAGLDLGPVALGLVLAGFMAAILSTADELLSCSAYALLADCMCLPREGTPLDVSRTYVSSAKLYTGFFAFAAAVLGITLEYLPRITDAFSAVAATQVVFFLPLLIALTRPTAAPRYWRVARLSMLLSFLVAVGAIGIGVVTGGDDGQALVDGGPLLGLLASLLCFGFGWLFIRKLKHSAAASAEGTSS